LNITDIHMHIIPQIDDGPENLDMSVEMLRSAYRQGVRNIICTSHNWSLYNKRSRYLRNIDLLRKRLEKEKINITLYTGSELYVNTEIIDEGTELVCEDPVFSLNGTHYILTEFAPEVGFDEAEICLRKLVNKGLVPVIAHAERYSILEVPDFEAFAAMGCLIQINTYSLVEEHDTKTKTKARELLSRRLVSFIGSDAHRTDHRPPNYTSGAEYILNTCDNEYAEAVIYANANKLLLKEV